MYLIYHNPRCSKSREALHILEEHGIQPEVRLYLQNPPSEKELRELETMLGKQLKDFIRTKEPLFKQFKSTDENLHTLVAKHPKLLERPIVVKDNKAVIGRPPEQVLTLLK